MKLYEMMQSGGPVMWPLLACSIVVLTVIGERLLFWLQIRRKRNRQLMDEILSLAEHGDWQAIKEKSQGCDDHVIRLLNVGILHREFDMAKAMEAEAQYTVRRMSKFMTLLDTMITVTPLMGILGTVIGIIASFEILGSGDLADPKLVTGGIAQALITTATGLTISIVTVFPYNYFKAKIEHAIHIMEKYATSLEVVYEKLMAGAGHEN
jgi:biopolymer transport protein ExbB